MSSEFPGSPLLLKGAIVVFETQLPVPTNIILFQYNPESMTRKIEQLSGGDQEGAGGLPRNPALNAGDSRNVLQAPVESYSLTIELDAADQLEQSDPLTMASGLHPALAALELLLYPKASDMITAASMAQAGTWVTAPLQTPMALFVWGAARVVPVQVTSLSITESAFDQALNPLQAKVDIDMRSLTDSELNYAGAPFDTLGLVNQVAKEALAHLALAGAVGGAAQTVRGLLPF